MSSRVLSIIFFSMFSMSSNAATFTYLESNSLSGVLNGPDLLWNTADDFTVINPGGFTGFNPQGGATNFLFDGIALFGSVTGSFETSGNVQTGVNTITSLNADVLSNDFSVFPPIIGISLTETLSATGSSTITIGAGNTATSSMVVDITDGIAYNDSFTLNGSYNYLNNGEDHNVIFAGNAEAISQFDYLLPFLPSDWDQFFIGSESFAFLSGPTGNQAGIFYTTAVPVPPAVWLFGSALIGLLGVSRRGQK